MASPDAPIYVLQHSPVHPPGYFQAVAARQGFSLRLHPVSPAAPLPPAGESLAGLVLLGGPYDLHPQEMAHRAPWMQQEIELIQRAVEADIPVLGHGLGAELIAAALDARVMRNTVKRIGWFEIQPLREEALAAQWLEGVADWLEMFQWHEQAFDLPLNATRLLRSQWNANEASVLGRTLALQGHLEVDAAIIKRWLAEYAPEVSQPRENPTVHTKLDINWEEIVQGPEAILSDIQGRLQRLHRVADLLYGRWLQSVEPGRKLCL